MMLVELKWPFILLVNFYQSNYITSIQYDVTIKIIELRQSIWIEVLMFGSNQCAGVF